MFSSVLLSVLVPLSGVVSGAPKITKPKERIVSPAEAERFLGSLLDGYRWAKSAGEREESWDGRDDGTADSRDINTIVGIREAIRDFESARLSVKPYLGSNAEAIRVAAETADASFAGLSSWNQKRLALMEDLVDEKPIPRGKLIRRTADIKDGINQSWKLLAWSAAAATHVLLIPKKEGEKYGKLNLTASGRAALLKRIDEEWGESVRGDSKAGTHALPFSVTTIRSFISDERAETVAESLEPAETTEKEAVPKESK
jgi:hypothetical protein